MKDASCSSLQAPPRGERPARSGRTRWAVCIAAALALCGCATEREARRGDELICPEYRSIACVGTPVCQMTERGCKSCQCPALFQNRNGPGFAVDAPSR